MGNLFKIVIRQLKGFLKLFVKKRVVFNALSNDEYFERFGFKNIDGDLEPQDKLLLQSAYDKSWENRNYEIDKFWSRATYFWGFIVLILGGYITLLTSEHNKKALEMRLDLYLVLLGFLFSIAWYLVILGSKCWQQNWEAHIDRLEDKISGPLYKTVFYSDKRFYSVSKINEIMAIAVILVWSAMLIQYLYCHFSLTTYISKMDLPATLALFVTMLFAFSLRFGYALGVYKTDKDSFLDRWA